MALSFFEKETEKGAAQQGGQHADRHLGRQHRPGEGIGQQEEQGAGEKARGQEQAVVRPQELAQ